LRVYRSEPTDHLVAATLGVAELVFFACFATALESAA
jgi:hypothetical protein